MGTHRIATLSITGIEHYRRSPLAARTHGCCRFAPTCSHYAEQALHRRSLPVALLLICWRLLRCRPSVPRGTYDPVPPPTRQLVRKASAVVLLSGFVTLGTMGLAQAVVPRTATIGGCLATINGTDIGAFNRNNALIVAKGVTVQVAGQAPGAIRTAAEPPGAKATIALDIAIVSPLKVTTQLKQTSGYRTFGTTENVDDYLKYGSGLYRIDADVTGSSVGGTDYHCRATFYVRLDGSDAPSIVAGVVALAGLGAAATAGGSSDWADGDTPPAAAGSADELASVEPDPDANRMDDWGELGCLIGLLAAFGLIDEDAMFFGAAMAPLSSSEGRGFRRRGHPVRGFLGGLMAGLGIAIVGQQQAYWYFTMLNVVVLPVAMGLLFGFRGWRGKAFKVVSAPSAG